MKATLLLSFLQTLCLLIFYCPLLYLPSVFTFHNLLILHTFSHSAYFLSLSFLRLRCYIAVPLTRFSAFLPPVSILASTRLLRVHPSSCSSVTRAFQGLLYDCMCEEGGFFPWGRRWKLGLTLSAEGRHLSLSAHLLEGSPITPPPFPCTHPSHPLSIHSPSLPHADLLCWITQECTPPFFALILPPSCH